MSPTSYQTAPPRRKIISVGWCRVKLCADIVWCRGRLDNKTTCRPRDFGTIALSFPLRVYQWLCTISAGPRFVAHEPSNAERYLADGLLPASRARHAATQSSRL